MNAQGEKAETSDGPDVANLRSYDAIADEWDGVRIRLSPREAVLLGIFLEDMPAGSRILDLGCGSGRPIAEELLRRGFAVSGLDQSPRMLEIARRRFPGAEWTRSRIEDWPACRRYPGVVAWDSLFHIPRERHASIFEKVHRSLLPRGRFALTVGGSEHPAFVDTMFGRRFFYDSHPPEAASQLLRDCGFDLVHGEFLNLPDGAGDKGRFAIVAAVAGA